MKISTKRLSILSLSLIMILLNIIVWAYIKNMSATDSLIIGFARLSFIEIVLTIILWRKIDDTFLSPFFIFYSVAVIYGVGQIFGWSLGINVGEKDLLTYGIDYEYILSSLVYSVCGLLAFYAGAVLFFNTNNKKIKNEQSRDNVLDIAAIDIVSKIIFFVSLPFLIIYWAKILPSIYMGGYLEYYTVTKNFTNIELIALMLADWFPISLLLVYAVNIKKKSMLSSASLILLFLYIIVTLYIGGRSVAVALLLALVITNQCFGKKFSRKQFIVMCVAAFLLISTLNVIAETRSTGNRTIMSTLEGMSFGVFDTIGGFIGEMGWQMSSVAWTMQFITNNGGFRFGHSYLTAFTVIIPNLGQWSTHPDTLVNAGDWMQNLLNRKTGMGYSFIAETYYNFSWFGLIALFILGCLISKWLTTINLKNTRYNYRYVVVIIMAFAVILRPFVRSTMSASLRKLVYVIFVIVLMVYLVKKIIIKKKNIMLEE